MNLNDAIRQIQLGYELSAETRNSLHAATEGHPLCDDKTLDQRKTEALWAITGKVNSQHRLQIERAK